MDMYKFLRVFVLLTLSAILLAGCAGSPETAEEGPVETPPIAEPEPEATEMEETSSDSSDTFQMGKAQYEETKRDLSDLVEELNQIIADQNYTLWQTYLTREYIDYYSSPEVLHELSQSPLMIKYNIKLRSLRDYFKYVVVASRKDVRIDDIKPLSENKVKAHMIINDEPIVVYTLQKVDDVWKITK